MRTAAVMKHALHAFLLVCFIALAAGCSGRFEAFAFQTAEGARIDIWQSPRVPADREALFRPSADRKASPVYHLARPVVIESDGQSFALSYASDIPQSTLTLLSDGKTAFATAMLPATAGNPVRYLVPLQRGGKSGATSFPRRRLKGHSRCGGRARRRPCTASSSMTTASRWMEASRCFRPRRTPWPPV